MALPFVFLIGFCIAAVFALLIKQPVILLALALLFCLGLLIYRSTDSL